MSLTVLNKKCLAVLLDLKVDISEFPDKTFDGLFETDNELKFFLEWFCENISGENALTDEERIAYDELKKVNQHVKEEELEKRLADCHPSYDDVKGLDLDCVNTLKEELEVLEKEHLDLVNVRHSLESQRNDIKKLQNNLLEENHKWKNNLEAVKEDCLDVNIEINNLLKDVLFFLLKCPTTLIDLSLFASDPFTIFEDEVSLCSNHGNPYETLEENLAVIERCKIISLGKLEEKKSVHSNLEKIVKNRKSRDDFMSTYCSPKGVNACENLRDEISLVAKNELAFATSNLSQLELSGPYSHFQFDKLYCVNNLIAKATCYKEYLETNEAFDLLLLHILRRSVDNVNNINDLISNFSDYLNKNRTGENDKIEFINWKRRRYEEVSTVINEKHPLLTALKEKVPDDPPKISCSMKLFVRNSALSHQSLCNEMENYIRKYAAKLVCGPTKQLQFTEIEIQKKFHACEYLLAQRKNEVKKLANKYLSFKNAIAQEDRSESLLWTLFLTNPEKLESLVRNKEEEILQFESKYSPEDE